jgi:hypothetical protein
MNTTQVLLIQAKPDAAIACDMTHAGDTTEERFAEYGRLFAHALSDRRRTGDAVLLTFKAKPGVTEWVADLVRREAACCPFVTYDVTSDGRQIVWKTSGPALPAVQALLDELYALPDRIGDGPEGLFARLADRGLQLTGSVNGRRTW